MKNDIAKANKIRNTTKWQTSSQNCSCQAIYQSALYITWTVRIKEATTATTKKLFTVCVLDNYFEICKQEII